MKLIRLTLYFFYIACFRFTPEAYRPYALFFPYLRRLLVKGFLKNCGCRVIVKYNADISPYIELGDNSELGTRCMIQSGVKIGKDVLMGPDVKIYGRNHRFERADIPVRLQGKTQHETTIGDDVWIGANVVILPGASVGNHAVIGAGAIITRDIPAWAIAGGNPATVIRYRSQDDAPSNSASSPGNSVNLE